MTSFKMMSSSNSDLSRRNSSSASSSPSIRSHNPKLDPHSRTSFASDIERSNGDRSSVNGGGSRRRSVDDVWKEIVSGEKKPIIKEEEEDNNNNIMMTLEDFLAKASAMEDDHDVKVERRLEDGGGSYTFDYPMMQQGSVSGEVRGKRGRVMMVEAMDKVAAQRQKRMIKNRESAARSRERKQAYQVKLETMAAKLEQENGELLKEIEEKTKERYKKLMEKLIPVDEKPKQLSTRCLSRSLSLEW